MLATFAAPLLLGFAVLRLLRARPSGAAATLAYAWLAGALATGLIVLGAALANVAPPSPLAMLAGAGVAFAASLVRRRAVEPDPFVPATRIERWVGGAALALCLAATVDRAVVSEATPILFGDEATIWAGRARALHFAGGLNESYRATCESESLLWHIDYPLLDPLLLLFANAAEYERGGSGSRWIIESFALATLLLAWPALRRRAGPVLAGALLILVAFADPFRLACRVAAADGMAAFGLLAAVVAAIEVAGGRRGAAIRLSLALAFLVWSKNEGTLLALCVLAPLALALRRAEPRPWAGAMKVLALPVALVAVQTAINVHFGFRNDLFDAVENGAFLPRLLREGPGRIPAYCRLLFEFAVMRVSDTHLLFAIAAGTWLFCPRRMARAAPLASAVVALAIAGFSVIYLGTYFELEFHVRTSMDRVLSHLHPVAALVVAAGLAELRGRERRAD